jgi:heme A synthase
VVKKLGLAVLLCLVGAVVVVFVPRSDSAVSFVFLGLAWFLAVVWWLVCLVEVVKTPDDVWASTGQNKLVNVLLIILLGWLGCIVYILAARPALQRRPDPVMS